MTYQPKSMQSRVDDLLSRIATCLKLNRPTIKELDKLKVEAQLLIPEAQDEVNRLLRIVMDPTTGRTEIDEAKRDAESAETDLKRLKTSLEQLTDRCDAELSAQEKEKRILEYERVRQECDELVEKIKNEWPDIQRQVEDLMKKICQSNLDVDRINEQLPEDRAPLERAEGRARGFPDRNSYETSASVGSFRIIQTVLPGVGPQDVTWPPDADFQLMVLNHGRLFPVREIMHRFRQSNLRGDL